MRQTSEHQKSRDRITTIFFDVGGVLLVDFIDQKVIDLANKYGKDQAELLKLRKNIRTLADAGKISDNDFWRNLLQEVGIEAVEEDYEVDEYMHPLEEGLVLARKLKVSGYKIAILSNDSREIFKMKREQYKFDELFDDVIVSNEHGFIKPHPELYHIALQRMKVQPHQTVFIDDREDNLIAAKELGIHTILYQNASQAELELVKLGIDLLPNVLA